MITLEVHDDLVPEKSRLSAMRYEAIARAVNSAVPNCADGVVSISYVSDDEIRRLNRMYRAKDAVTDVLSFASGMPKESGEVGDVIISFDQAGRQAEMFADDGEPDIELECTDLVVHGILHILGYDHELPQDAEQMFPLQDSIVERVL